jgi:hypothetical protein
MNKTIATIFFSITTLTIESITCIELGGYFNSGSIDKAEGDPETNAVFQFKLDSTDIISLPAGVPYDASFSQDDLASKVRFTFQDIVTDDLTKDELADNLPASQNIEQPNESIIEDQNIAEIYQQASNDLSQRRYFEHMRKNKWNTGVTSIKKNSDCDQEDVGLSAAEDVAQPLFDEWTSDVTSNDESLDSDQEDVGLIAEDIKQLVFVEPSSGVLVKDDGSELSEFEAKIVRDVNYIELKVGTFLQNIGKKFLAGMNDVESEIENDIKKIESKIGLRSLRGRF